MNDFYILVLDPTFHIQLAEAKLFDIDNNIIREILWQSSMTLLINNFQLICLRWIAARDKQADIRAVQQDLVQPGLAPDCAVHTHTQIERDIDTQTRTTRKDRHRHTDTQAHRYTGTHTHTHRRIILLGFRILFSSFLTSVCTYINLRHVVQNHIYIPN